MNAHVQNSPVSGHTSGVGAAIADADVPGPNVVAAPDGPSEALGGAAVGEDAGVGALEATRG